jgi:hypothetical protein
LFSLVSGLELRQPYLHSGRTAHNLLGSSPAWTTDPQVGRPRCRRHNARRQV